MRDSQGDRIETFRAGTFRIEIFRTGTSRIRIPRIGTFRIEISHSGIPCIETSHTGTFRKLAHTASLHPRRPAAMAWVTNTIGVTNTVGRVSQGNIKTSSIPMHHPLPFHECLRTAVALYQVGITNRFSRLDQESCQILSALPLQLVSLQFRFLF